MSLWFNAAWWLFVIGVCSLFALLALAVISAVAVRFYFDGLRVRQSSKIPGRLLVGFFHPHSTGGGGGERVLWTMLNALMHEWPQADFIVYTHWSKEKGTATHDAVEKLVLGKFGIALPRPVKIVQLQGVTWIEPSSYPRLTLLLQSLGAVPLAYEALKAQVPDVFVDSQGLALSYPLASFCCRCKVASYVHYPVVSSDMLAAVRERQAKFNNSGAVARSPLLTRAKILYYRAFAKIYGYAGRHCDVVMVNSSWTKGHIVEIWGLSPAMVHRVYPPCDVAKLVSLGNVEKELAIVSVAQFRPEKDHPLQLQAFKLVLDRLSLPNLRLHLVGGVRNEEDKERVRILRQMAIDLNIAGQVDFHVDMPYADLLSMLGRSAFGLHTMRDEHFGIVVVEYMAAGCVPVAHNSAGPKMDIVQDGCGFLAESAEEFADKIIKLLSMPPSDLAEMRQRGKQASQRFTEQVFSQGVCEAMASLSDRSTAPFQ